MKTEFKRQASCQWLFFFLFPIVMALVPGIEFINAPGSINKFHLARIEWMGGIGDLHLDQRVFLSVFEGNCFS